MKVISLKSRIRPEHPLFQLKFNIVPGILDQTNKQKTKKELLTEEKSNYICTNMYVHMTSSFI